MLEFDWDDANIAHIAAHGVTPAQAEEVIRNSPYDLDEQDFEGETRFAQIGETNSGRILLVVLTLRTDRIRVVTAYETGRALKKFYLTQRLRDNSEPI